MAPARATLLTPPTRQSVTDTEGSPTCDSDPFKFVVFLNFAEKRIKTADKQFFELYTFGYVTTTKGTVVATAEQAIELASVNPRQKYKFGTPSPVLARTATELPEALKTRYLLQPDAVFEIYRYLSGIYHFLINLATGTLVCGIAKWY